MRNGNLFFYMYACGRVCTYATAQSKVPTHTANRRNGTSSREQKSHCTLDMWSGYLFRGLILFIYRRCVTEQCFKILLHICVAGTFFAFQPQAIQKIIKLMEKCALCDQYSTEGTCNCLDTIFMGTTQSTENAYAPTNLVENANQTIRVQPRRYRLRPRLDSSPSRAVRISSEAHNFLQHQYPNHSIAMAVDLLIGAYNDLQEKQHRCVCNSSSING